MAWLEPPRIYQSLIVETTGLFAAVVEVAPPGTLGGRPPETIRNAALDDPDWTFSRRIRQLRQEQVFDTLIALLLASDRRYGLDPSLENIERNYLTFDMRLADNIGIRSLHDATNFARYLLAARVVPFERSPLGPESIGVLTGEGIATLAQVGQQPLLWVEAAGALVLVKAILRWGRAVADVGDDAIRYHLPRLLRLPRRTRPDDRDVHLKGSAE